MTVTHLPFPPRSVNKEPPHSVEVEQALLGALLIDNRSADVLDDLEVWHFFDPLHARIYETAVKVIRGGSVANPVTLKASFEALPPIGDLTVPQYLGRLVARATTASNAGNYAKALIDLARRRQLVVAAEEMSARAVDMDQPATAAIEETERQLFQIAKTASEDARLISIGAAVRKALANAQRAMSTGGVSAIGTGLTDLDRKLGGLHPSDLIILAGRPSMGKTALATNIALAAAQDFEASGGKRGAQVAFFSLEMSSDQLGTRLLAETSGVDSEKIRRGLLSTESLENLRKSETGLATLPLEIDETGGISIAKLATKARRLKRQKGLGLVVVDYLQLMTGSSNRRDGNRVQEITEITTGLKALAKDLQVPVLALSQLSRNLEGRDDKRPQLSDLRESGSIEQDADVVMFVFREEYYVSRQEPPMTEPMKFADWQAAMNRCRGRAEIIIGKQRHGPIGKVEVGFDARLTKFRNLAMSEKRGADD